MDSFKLLKRRTTELFNSIPSSLPAIKSPTFGSNSNTMKGTWEKLHLPPLPRSGHTANIVDGAVYIFGGGKDNDVHAITLPASGAQADCYAIKAKPAKPTNAPKPKDANPDVPSISIEETPDNEPQNLSDVPLSSPPPASAAPEGKSPASPTSSLPDIPPARKGHASAVIGHRIFIFGGSSPSSSEPLNESGRVWVFDTRTHLWSFLDPALATPTHPSGRYGHSAVATTKPDSFSPSRGHHSSSHQTWTEWALGTDSTTLHEQGIPQDPVVGFLAEKAKDLDSEGYGTFIISGGTLSSGEVTNETWAFDIHSSTWQPLPASPSPPVSGASLALAKNRLYKFGGFPVIVEGEGRIEYLELSLDSFNDVTSAGEVLVTAKGGWKNILQGKTDVGYITPDPTAVPLEEEKISDWPEARANASLSVVTIGGENGREYLLLAFGEDEKRGKLGDVWAFLTAGRGGASFVKAQDAVLGSVGGLLGKGGNKHQEGRWFRVEMEAEDEEDDESAEGPAGRAGAAVASIGDLEESGVVVWGGVGEGERVRGDGWVLRLK